MRSWAAPRRLFSIDGKPLSLYRHQAQAVAKAATGQSFVVTTGTGSGKSLCFFYSDHRCRDSRPNRGRVEAHARHRNLSDECAKNAIHPNHVNRAKLAANAVAKLKAKRKLKAVS